MKQNYKLYFAALLLVGATGMMTAGAQGSGKPTLAVFVVGGDNSLVTPLTAALRTNLTSGGQYTLTSVSTSGKFTELQAAYTAGGGSSINRDALAAWGQTNSISTICLVVDDVKGSDHMFYAHLIDAKDSKLSGKGSYVRTGVSSDELSRVALALAKQLDGSGRRRSTPAPTRSYPAELDIEMVRVEGGRFTMGCTAEQVGCLASEKPTHIVTVSSFSMGKFEVTQAQWKAVMTGVAGTSAANVGEIYSFKDDDQHPAQNMDWFEAVTFCNELSRRVGLEEVYTITGTGTSKTVTWDMTKKGYRLPTEAEWEYAARGCQGDGSVSDATCENLLYSGSNDPDEVGWHSGNSGKTVHPVGQKKPNKLGIYDMSGNVWEWVYDRGGSYSSTAATNPTGPTGSGSNRVLRGSCWLYGIVNWGRVSSREISIAASDRLTNRGFRLALP
ncbi:MAG: formylglycine-generating enzyme family protein [Prevotellaceae bacterium]|jgi:formylglycine-generating enzyme required for sulfatase activity|nr:formylglycine-generating enzyme family protein [Prevotellaceae bacterium]